MKLIAKIIIAVLIFVAGFYVGQKQAWSPSNGGFFLNNQQPPAEIQASLTIAAGDSEPLIFDNITLANEATAFDLLKKITAENNIELGYKDYGGELGVLVESINDVANNLDANEFWQYWVNDEFAQVGASSYILADGDKVEWRYAKSEF